MALSILCIGDLVGKAGRSLLSSVLPPLIEEHQLDLVVCNAENAAGGSGLTPQIFQKLQRYGVDVVTLGDHCFRKKEALGLLSSQEPIVRPINLPKGAAGRGMCIATSKTGRHRVAVLSLLGQLNMGNNDSPWNAVDEAFRHIPEDVKLRIVDFHAEATSEKIAMGWHCNGRATIVFGTHTHVPTADAGVLDRGTAFICDLGMTGPYDSVLGRRKDRVLKYLTSGMPQRFDMAVGDPRMYGLLVQADESTGKALSCELICRSGQPDSDGAYDRDDGQPQHRRS